MFFKCGGAPGTRQNCLILFQNRQSGSDRRRILKLETLSFFFKEGDEQKLGQVIWTIRRVVEAVPSHTNGKVRQVKIEYSNAAQFWDGRAPLCTTNRAARSVALLARG
jgi:hypothetical protein